MTRSLSTLRTLAALLVGAATLSACDAANPNESRLGAGEPALALNENERLPFTATVNVCGDVIQFDGTFHIVTTSTVTRSGRVHYKFHINAKGTGVGASGATYQWTASINRMESFDSNDGFPRAATFVQTLKLIGQGGAPNLILKAHFHVTVNANGVLTAEFERIEVTCH